MATCHPRLLQKKEFEGIFGNLTTGTCWEGCDQNTRGPWAIAKQHQANGCAANQHANRVEGHWCEFSDCGSKPAG